MKIRSMLIVCSAVIFSVTAFYAAPALAQQKTVKACQEEWKANEAANKAAKITEKDYVAKCRAEGAAAQPASKPAAAPAPKAAAPAPAETAKTTAAKPKDGHAAEVARERACSKDWKADKAAGKVAAGMKWPEYWSECDKRKKAMGM